MEITEQQTETTKRKIRVGRPPKSVGKPKCRYRPFREAKIYAQRQKLSSKDEWKAFTKLDKFPEDIPLNPDLSYPDHWKGWEDFLGCGFLSFEEARARVRPYKLISHAQYREKWEELFSRPNVIPLRPQRYYRGEWISWEDFLGVKRTNPNRDKSTYRSDQLTPFKKGTHYRPFMEAVKYVSTLGLRDHVEWLKWRGKYVYEDLPWRPDEVYDKDWKGWAIWLGHDPLPGLLENVAVLFVGKHVDDPANVYRIEVCNMGKSVVMHRATNEGFTVIRMWKYDPNLREEVRKVLELNTSSYYGSDQLSIVANIHGLFNDLFSLLPVVR
jgi:hypothetical protein